MATKHISGPFLRQYPDMLRELKRLHISTYDIRYVELTTKELAFRNKAGEAFGMMEYEPQAIAILHTGESVPLTHITLTYNPIPRARTGALGDGKCVTYKKRVWNETLEASVPGIRFNSRNLTADQSLELLEWLEQERPTLEQKAMEEQEQTNASRS